MFVVKNITKNDISIPELNVLLSPGEQLDLDMVTSRFYTDQSGKLRGLIKNNGLKCIVKDDGSGMYQIKRAENVSIKDRNSTDTSPSDVIDAVKKLEEKIYKKLDERISSQIDQPKIDINLVNQALAALQGIASQSAQKNNIQQNIETESNVKESLVVNIQKRTLDRLASGSSSNVRSEEQTTDSNVTKNIQELEGLL